MSSTFPATTPASPTEQEQQQPEQPIMANDGINVLIGEEVDEDATSEYETDTSAEEGEEDDSAESSFGEEEQWSLRVRLLSAVDLPPSLSPTVPLCPWFKFGLVDDVNVALDEIVEEKERVNRQLMEQQEQEKQSSSSGGNSEGVNNSEREEKKKKEEMYKKKILQPKRQSDSDDDDSQDDESECSSDEEEETKRQSTTTELHPQHPPQQHPPHQQQPVRPNTTNNNMNTTSRLLTTIPTTHTRTSTSKIMSRNINGGGGNGADWNEEYRWNDLCTPMESCLLVRLNTRLAPDSSVSMSGATNLGLNTSMLSGGEQDFISETGSGGYLQDNETETNLGSGLRGLWRKGTRTLEEHARKRASISANPREERAAAVAQFLMRGGSSGGQHHTNDGGGMGMMDQQDLVEYQQRWNEVKNHTTGGGGGDGYDDEYDVPLRTSTLENDNRQQPPPSTNTAEGLCLGTLTIPLSRLPLEDAFMGEGSSNAAVVEKWYQLDDPNMNKKTTERDDEDDNDDGGGSNIFNDDDDDNGEPTLLHGPRRCPSVLLEITFASSDYLDEAEDDVTQHLVDDAGVDLSKLQLDSPVDTHNSPLMPVSPSPKEEEEKATPPKKEEPELEQGIIDYICIVGARDIGNQRNDDGSKGWVQSTPECCVLERYPPDDEFHIKNGRQTSGLIPQIEWFCFPEGCKLWRGSDAPNNREMKAGGVSMTSPPSSSSSAHHHSSAAALSSGMSSRHPIFDEDDYTPTKFDRVLGTTSSFSWFVLSSNSDVYGSRLVKTYGVMIRFYVPAPVGIDPTQDDFAQTMNLGGGGGGAVGGTSTGGKGGKEKDNKAKKRLWVPIGICLTTTIPIVGIAEEILLRSCNALASRLSADDGSATELLTSSSIEGDASAASCATATSSKLYTMLQTDLYHFIVNFSKPMESVVHCSIPFLDGDRLHVTTCLSSGLPPLPHGGAVAMTCRLLGAEGLTLLLAASLTECRVLIHSTNVANVAMVAEVITALLFPFTWQLPYIPVLAQQMLEVLDAPLPYFVGLPTASLQTVDKSSLSEIVVVDLDDVASFTEYDSRRGPRSKVPPALPASVSASISKAVYRLLKEEDELDKMTEKTFFPGTRPSPRLEAESLPERMFRIHVAMQICSLVRGYQECLFFVSALQPVFNRDRFLRQAPALFEDKRPNILVESNISDRTQKILSPRAKRFLSVLVNTQHFHQLLERLSSEETAFFHEVMEAIEGDDEDPTEGGATKKKIATNFGSSAFEMAAENLFESLERTEQKIPTYVVSRPGRARRPGVWSWQDDNDDETFKIEPYVESDEPFWLLPEEKPPEVPFTYNILQPIMADKANDPTSSSEEAGVHALSLEYLVELEKNPWRYGNMLELPMAKGEDGNENVPIPSVTTQVQPRIKLREAIGERRFREWKIANDHKDDDDMNVSSPVVEQTESESFDLSSILLNVPELPTLEGKPESTHTRDADDREKVRHCLELAFGSGQHKISDTLISEAELALRNPSAQRYLFSVLVSSVQRKKRTQEDAKQRTTVSRLEPNAFECIVRLCYAVLEACTEEQNYESAYRLLTFTGGFCCSTSATSTPSEQKTIYMTERISIHPIFADLRLWERVLLLHQQDQQNSKEEDAAAAAAAKEANAEDNEDGEDSVSEEDGNNDNEDSTDNDAYDSVVTTL